MLNSDPRSIYDNGCQHNWQFKCVVPDDFAQWECVVCGIQRTQNLAHMMNDFCGAQQIAKKYEDRYFACCKAHEETINELHEGHAFLNNLGVGNVDGTQLMTLTDRLRECHSWLAERDALRAENALLKAEVRRCHALGKKSHSFTGSLASKAIFEEIPAAVAELLKESASATACAIKERRWYRHDEITRDIHGGLCWWWWNGDDMFPVVIGYSPTTQRWYAERGQWGWTDARYLDEMGGLWTPCVKPHDPPDEMAELLKEDENDETTA